MAQIENMATPNPPEPVAAEPPELPGTAPSRLPAFLRRRSLWVVAGLLLLLVVGFVYRYVSTKAKVTYETAQVERGDLESTVVAAGIVQPFLYVDVGAQTSGKLKSLKVQRGDQVEKNLLLAEIDPELAGASLTAANAALQNMTSQRSVKQAQLVLAKAERVRNDRLFAEQLISANDRDTARANYEVAVAEVSSLSAQMRQAGAAINTARANVGYTKITAPMAGEVVSITTLEGQTVNASQLAPTILRIADMSTVTVWAQVSEADIVHVKLGQEVYFTVLGQSRHWTGKIRQILPTPELINNVVFYDVLFDIPNADGVLKIQMTAQVFIVQARVKGVLLVPAAAIGNALEGSEIQVQILKSNGTVEARTIKIGIKSEISAEVTSGLQEKERVVTKTITTKASTKSVLPTKKVS